MADKLIPLQTFIREYLGLRDRNWWYKHRNDPGVPQVVPMGRKPMVSLEEVERFIEAKKKARAPAVSEPPPLKRKRGRPRKHPVQPAA